MAKYDGTWYGKALITLRAKGATNAVEMAALTKDVEIGGLEKTIDQIALANGGYISKKNPVSNIEVTFSQVYLLGNEDLLEYFLGKKSGTTNLTYGITNDFTYVRLAMLWTDDPNVTTAEGTTAAGYTALRVTVNNGHIEYLRPKTEDRNMVWEMRVVALPMDRDGNENLQIEYTDADADGLPALPTY